MSATVHSNVRAARAEDTSRVLALLADSRLPTEDVTTAHDLRIWIAESNGAIQGVIALERFGNEGLLRSLAVSPGCRQRGLGRELVAHVERHAQMGGITRLVLLTETAERFFDALGYEVTDRHLANDGMRQSAEFRSLCPASAVCMSKTLYGSPLK